MRLIGDDNDVVPHRVPCGRIYFLVEFLNKCENIRLVVAEELPELLAGARPAWVLVVINDTATCKCLIDLRVQVVTIRTEEKCIVSPELAVHFPREEHHRVALA